MCRQWKDRGETKIGLTEVESATPPIVSVSGPGSPVPTTTGRGAGCGTRELIKVWARAMSGPVSPESSSVGISSPSVDGSEGLVVFSPLGAAQLQTRHSWDCLAFRWTALAN